MLVAALGALAFLPSESEGGNLAWFYVAFMLLFLTTGVGNGSVFHMVPTVFVAFHRCRAEDKGRETVDQVTREGTIEASVALGFTAAIAALGLFFIPMAVGVSMNTTGAPHAALSIFIAFYLSCMLATWWWYGRKGAEIPCDGAKHLWQDTDFRPSEAS